MEMLLLFFVIQAGLAFHDTDEKIVGGETATAGKHPYVVSIQIASRTGSNAHFCGGSIVDQYYIVTAAHCVWRKGIADRLRVVAGVLNLDKPTTYIQKRSVSEVFVHPNYTSRAFRHDIALLKVAKPFELNMEVQSAKIQSDCNSITEGKMSQVCGWGHTKEGGILSTDLLTVDVPLWSDSECNKAYRSYGYSISKEMICAGEEAGGKDSCQGDSGGPLFLDGFLTGIVSWGYGCAREGLPGVYTETCYYNEWINSIIGSSPTPTLIS